MTRDAPHQQESFKPSNISDRLDVMQRLKQMPSIKENHGGSFIENPTVTRHSNFTRFGTFAVVGDVTKSVAVAWLDPYIRRGNARERT